MAVRVYRRICCKNHSSLAVLQLSQGNLYLEYATVKGNKSLVVGKQCVRENIRQRSSLIPSNVTAQYCQNIRQRRSHIPSNVTAQYCQSPGRTVANDVAGPKFPTLWGYKVTNQEPTRSYWRQRSNKEIIQFQLDEVYTVPSEMEVPRELP